MGLRGGLKAATKDRPKIEPLACEAEKLATGLPDPALDPGYRAARKMLLVHMPAWARSLRGQRHGARPTAADPVPWFPA
jgi:hypothetical protein